MLKIASGFPISAPALPLTSNLLLKQLEPDDRLDIERHSEFEKAAAGTILFEAGSSIDSVYFPIDTMVGLEQSGRIEVAIAGREGMVGWTAISGFAHSPYRAVVRSRDGWLYRMSLEPLLAAFAAKARLRWLLTQYAIFSAVQMAEGLGAHSHHRLESAIARWLLLRHDRVGGDWIRAQHQEIADNLGARRASVTDCLHIIEGNHHIRCRRGRILIRDRGQLEACAQGAYGAAESLYRASLGQFGKMAAVTRLEEPCQLYEPA